MSVNTIAAFAQEIVKQATDLGIVNGRSGNKFEPKANATSAKSAVMLYFALGELNKF